MNMPSSSLNTSNLKNILSKFYIFGSDSGLATTGLVRITAWAALWRIFCQTQIAPKKGKKFFDRVPHVQSTQLSKEMGN
jgi:hypothetical protein